MATLYLLRGLHGSVHFISQNTSLINHVESYCQECVLRSCTISFKTCECGEAFGRAVLCHWYVLVHFLDGVWWHTQQHTGKWEDAAKQPFDKDTSAWTKDKVEEIQYKGKEYAERAEGAAYKAAEEVKDKAKSAKDSAADTVKDTAKAAKDMASDAAESAKEQAPKAYDNICVFFGIVSNRITVWNHSRPALKW
jgi:hypothetical protein